MQTKNENIGAIERAKAEASQAFEAARKTHPIHALVSDANPFDPFETRGRRLMESKTADVRNKQPRN